MRRISISPTLGRVRDPAARDALQEIEKASQDENLTDIAQAFSITGTYTETRILNVGVSTLAETQAFIATLVNDFKRGGSNRSV